MNGIRRFLIAGSGLALTVGMVLAAGSSASAYGKANWQVAFSGNFNNAAAGGGGGGFWGWCDFAGGVQSGDDADCAFSNYFFTTGGASGGFLATVQIEGTAWDVEPTTFPAPGFPPNDFFITAGSVKLTGPAVVQAIAAGIVPPACTLAGSTATCPIAVVEAAGLFSPDTGVPAAPGHYSLKNILRMLGFTLPPGSQLNIQVVQIQ
jgi:hypothetical protein